SLKRLQPASDDSRFVGFDGLAVRLHDHNYLAVLFRQVGQRQPTLLWSRLHYQLFPLVKIPIKRVRYYGRSTRRDFLPVREQVKSDLRRFRPGGNSRVLNQKLKCSMVLASSVM